MYPVTEHAIDPGLARLLGIAAGSQGVSLNAIRRQAQAALANFAAYCCERLILMHPLSLRASEDGLKVLIANEVPGKQQLGRQIAEDSQLLKLFKEVELMYELAEMTLASLLGKQRQGVFHVTLVDGLPLASFR